MSNSRLAGAADQICPTRVRQPDPDLVHSGFEGHGEGAEDYAAAMGSPQGWEYILSRLG
jgi:hypothetical protein